MSELKKFLFGAMAAIALFGILFAIGPAFSPIGVNAQKIAQPCTDCPLIGNPKTIPTGAKGIADFILNIAKFVTYIVGAIAVLFLVYGGFLFVTDGGDGKKAGQGKQIFFNAVIGLALAIAAYAIVAVIGQVFQGDILQQINNQSF